MIKRLIGWLLFFSLLFSVKVAAASLKSLAVPVSSDSYLKQVDPTFNYGASPDLRVSSEANKGKKVGNVSRSLLYFSLPTLPPNSLLENATVNLFALTVPNKSRTYYLYKLANSWLEGTGNGVVNNPAVNGVTWYERQYGDNIWTGSGPYDWLLPGGDFSGPLATTSTPNANNWMSWSVTTEVVNIYNGSFNYGFLIKDSNEANPSLVETSFVAKEDPLRTAQWPNLNLTYLTPETSVTPNSVVAATTTTVTLTVTNKGDATADELTAFNFSIPAGWHNIPTTATAFTLTPPPGKNWYISQQPLGTEGTQTVEVRALSSLDDLAAGESLQVSFSLMSPYQLVNTAWPNAVQGAFGVWLNLTPLPVTIQAGSLSFTTDSTSQTLAPVSLTGLDSSTTGNLGNFTVIDGRGNQAGWQLVLTSSDFTLDSSPTLTIPASNFFVQPAPAVTYICGNPTLPTANSGVLAFPGVAVLVAASGTGDGQYQVNPPLELLVPASTYAGSYEATVTVTLSSL